MKTIWLCMLVGLLYAVSSPAGEQEHKPAQVMLLGVFHFANPGLDVVKTDQIDVMTEENQAYLRTLSTRISAFDPTVVLLEFNPSRDAEIQARFQQFIEGDFDLPSNEIYQLGFRIAAQSSAETIHGYDETDVQWQAQPLFEYLQNGDTDTGARMSALIRKITEDKEQAHATLSIQELLIRSNDPDRDALNRATYLVTNHVGDATSFVGADAAASWWHRNFRMYALVQRYAQPGERVLVIGGQGHTAILRQLLADDLDREAVSVQPYLQLPGG